MGGFSFGSARRGAWGQAAQRLSRGTQTARKTEALAVKRAALLTEREMKKGIRAGAPGGKAFKPLSPMTRLLRRGRRPLVDTGALLGSIKTTFSEATASAFVGVHRTSQSSSGESIVNIAAIHEFGTGPFAMKVTEGMRKFFIALSIKTGGRIKPISSAKTVIMHPGIPARPFIRPTVEKLAPTLEKMIAKVVNDKGIV